MDRALTEDELPEVLVCCHEDGVSPVGLSLDLVVRDAGSEFGDVDDIVAVPP
jgi:hypothetical protein